MMKKFLSFFTDIIILLLIVAAAADFSAEGASEPKLQKIRIPDMYDPTCLYLPYIADSLGYFEEEGTKAVFTGVIPAGQHVAAVVAGTNDVGAMHINRTIVGIAGGAKLKVVVAEAETTKEFPHMEYIALETSDIKDPNDLSGKRVGVTSVGGCNEYTPYEWLKKAVAIDDPRGKFEFVIVPPGNLEVALRTREVDVIGVHGHPYDIFERGGVKVVFDDYDVWANVGGAAPYYFREDFIKKNPDAVKAFVNAISRAAEWTNEHQQEARVFQAKRLNLEPKQVAVLYYVADGIIKPETVQMWADLLLKYGEIKKPVDISRVYTNEFNKNARDKAQK
ncbi:MAG: ABC transporter substrate-binding protein [Synergistaceae bacterium]|jgi:ABC-type nitrate/sulfonate/bicarbonate transport system substrate-binding protein|nr:ABC transporter substrate-binding protein [Synergistaceae bacterium]